MLGHLIKLIWMRRSRNLMLSLEIMLAFILVFAVAAFGARNIQVYRQPVGIAIDNIWSVSIHPTEELGFNIDPPTYVRLRQALMTLPQVEALAFASFSPYRFAEMSNDFVAPGSTARVEVGMEHVGDGFMAVSKLHLLAGRWLDGVETPPGTLPVVINRRLAETMFPHQSPLGKTFDPAPARRDLTPDRTAVGQNFISDEHAAARQHRMLVTGVIEDYRNQGEFMRPANFMLVRAPDVFPEIEMRGILIKLRPGLNRSVEAQLNARLRSVRSDWRYEIAPLSELRSSMLRLQLAPLQVFAIIAAFLLLMVCFGLFGVLWQNTTMRIPEIGLRRALGANAADIYRQIVAEQLLLSTAAMLAGSLLLVQLPLTRALGESLDWQVYFAATGMSMCTIYLISLLCSLYPGWRASRLSPIEALHEE